MPRTKTFSADFDNRFDAEITGATDEAALKAYVKANGGGSVEWVGADDEDGEDFNEFKVRMAGKTYYVKVAER